MKFQALKILKIEQFLKLLLYFYLCGHLGYYAVKPSAKWFHPDLYTTF